MTNAKTITRKISFALAAAGIALSAASVSAEEVSGSALSAESQALLALVSTGALKPVNVAIAEKRIASSPESRLSQAGLVVFSLDAEAEEQEAFMLKPQFTPKFGQDTSDVTFASLDQFFVSVTEQDRAGISPTIAYDPSSVTTQQGALPTTSRNNLLNSRFANLLATRLTGKGK